MKYTVIFDMDGVILDSERVYQEIERSMYDELGIPVPLEEHLKFMGAAERVMWQYMHKRYKLRPSVQDLIREERRRFLNRLEAPGSIPLMTGLLPLVESLRQEGIPCWIASSSTRYIIQSVLRIHGLQKYFNGYVGGDDIKQSKPSPEIFLRTAALSGTEPSRCLVIEDSENGIEAARAAGMTVIALQGPENMHLRLSDADLIIHRLEEIHPQRLAELMQ